MYKNIKYLIIIVILALNGTFATVYAQNDSLQQKLVKYTPEFRFKDGIFVNFQQVRNNNPIPKMSIQTSLSYTDYQFFEKLLENTVITVFDNYGMPQELEVEKIWGYSQNGTLFINWNDTFNRIPVVGNLSHFVANVTVYHNNYQHYNTNPYHMYNYHNSYMYPPPTSTTSELHQYILDFETGNVLEFNQDNLEMLLGRDPELLQQYNSLRKRKKKQLVFLYLRKYNERNPLFLPVWDG